jgi:transposase-like protein
MQFSGEERDANLELIEKLWPVFETRIPDDAAAMEFVLQTLLTSSALHCQCGTTVKKKLRSKRPRTLICKNCKKEIWFTARTPFKRAERLKAWLGAIYLMGHGAIVTSNKLAELGGTAISTALNIVRTIGLVLENERQKEKADMSIEVPSKEFDSLFCRRSLLTLPKVHPSTEINDPKANVEPDTNQKQTGAEADTVEQLSESELEILELISNEPITADQICQRTTQSASAVASALVMLEIEGLIQSQPGGRFSRRSDNSNNKNNHDKKKTRQTNMAAAMPLVGRAIDSTRSIRGGISRKYLQVYLAAIWCQLDRARWNEEKLLLAFLRAPEITYQDILNYESPAIASMMTFS